MINLLPPEAKESITYARRNTKLARWTFIVMMSFVGIAAVVVFGLLYMSQSIAANQQQITDTQAQLKAQHLEETQKRVQDISSSLKLVVQVLSKEVLFSKLLQQIGAAIPADTVLTGLSINKLQGGIDLQAGAANYNAATQLQLNLQDPRNQIFDKADIVSIQCNSNTTGQQTDSRYPCSVIVRAQFATNNPFLFINTTVVKP